MSNLPGHVASVLNELGFRYDPSDLYQQTICGMLDAAELVELPHHLRLILCQPQNEIMVHFPVRLEDGSYRLCKGYRVQHNNALGPYKGGIRYHEDVSLDHIKSLAVLMTLKCSLARLPLGGAKGGVQVNPNDFSKPELCRLTRRFTKAICEHIGPDKDIPAPDMGTNAQIMAWMADTFMNTAGGQSKHYAQSVVTGKPLEFGGSHGREKATGQGLVYALSTLAPAIELDCETSTFRVIGYGNVGSWTARLLERMGMRLTAVLDHSGAIYNPTGLDAERLARHARSYRCVAGYGRCESITEKEFYAQNVDLLVPAALEQMITLDRAKNMRCRIIAEGANAPTTPEAEAYLLDQGVTILPAILCNSGGVTVSYYEWNQNRRSETWSETYVDSQLEQMMTAAAVSVERAAMKYGCDLRTAAYCVALEYIRDMYKVRGIFP